MDIILVVISLLKLIVISGSTHGAGVLGKVGNQEAALDSCFETKDDHRGKGAATCGDSEHLHLLLQPG